MTEELGLIEATAIVTCPYCEIPTMRVGCVNLDVLPLAVAACDLCGCWGSAEAYVSSEAIRFSRNEICRELMKRACKAVTSASDEKYRNAPRLTEKVRLKLREGWTELKRQQAKEVTK